jgi:hypothetical protein
VTRALVIPARAEPHVVDIDTQAPGVLHNLVEGYLEAYRIPGHDARMYMNEDGVRLNLPPNSVASRLFHGGVAGTVVVLGTGAEPLDADVPQSVLDLYGL